MRENAIVPVYILRSSCGVNSLLTLVPSADQHTRALLAEVRRIEVSKRPFVAIKGELPSPLNPPHGCHFHPRCPHATDRCRTEALVIREAAPGHRSACHLNETI